MGWININDFKPDERSEKAHQNVLCYGSRWDNVYTAQYVNGRFKFKEGTQEAGDIITHWMSIPESPKQ